jgi:hypothetical protein
MQLSAHIKGSASPQLLILANMSEEVSRQQFLCECGGRYFASGKRNHLQTLKHLYYIRETGSRMDEFVPSTLVPAKPKVDGLGNFFECSWTSPSEKFVIVQKLQSMKENVEAFAIGIDSDGSSSRTIAIVKTVTKISKQKFRQLIQSVVGEVKRCKKWKALVQTITRNDTDAFVYGFARKLLSIRYRAYKYAQSHEKVDWENAVPCSVGEKKRFENLVLSFHRRRTDQAMQNAVLKPWQESVSDFLSTRDQNRWWIYDEVGGTGKTFLADYLRARKGALMFDCVRPKHIVNQYRGESMVVFDFLDASDGKVSYNHLNRLAKGQVLSAGMATPLKLGGTPNVICFSSFRPNLKVLRREGWSILEIDEAGNLTFLSFE